MKLKLTTMACSALLMFTAAGCSTPVLQSSVPVPDGFVAAATSGTTAEVAWGEHYGDPVLSDLIRRAAHENRDVRIAAERVRAARAGEAISRSWLLPTLSAAAGATDQRTGYSGSARQAAESCPTNREVHAFAS